MSGAELTALVAERDPWDWYCDEGWETRALLERTPIGAEMFVAETEIPIYDPCCGRGGILWGFAQDDFSVFGSDIIYRGVPQEWWSGVNDFIRQDVGVKIAGNSTIAFNPPYTIQGGAPVKGLTEQFCRRALEIATHKVCALVPLKWLASKGRYRLFTDHPPRAIYVLSERPSMPPGHIIEALGDDAFRNGKIDYMWVIWDKRYAVPKGGARIDWIESREDWEIDIDRAARKAGERP